MVHFSRIIIELYQIALSSPLVVRTSPALLSYLFSIATWPLLPHTCSAIVPKLPGEMFTGVTRFLVRGSINYISWIIKTEINRTVLPLIAIGAKILIRQTLPFHLLSMRSLERYIWVLQKILLVLAPCTGIYSTLSSHGLHRRGGFFYQCSTLFIVLGCIFFYFVIWKITIRLLVKIRENLTDCSTKFAVKIHPQAKEIVRSDYKTRSEMLSAVWSGTNNPTGYVLGDGSYIARPSWARMRFYQVWDPTISLSTIALFTSNIRHIFSMRTRSHLIPFFRCRKVSSYQFIVHNRIVLIRALWKYFQVYCDIHSWCVSSSARWIPICD